MAPSSALVQFGIAVVDYLSDVDRVRAGFLWLGQVDALPYLASRAVRATSAANAQYPFRVTECMIAMNKTSRMNCQHMREPMAHTAFTLRYTADRNEVVLQEGCVPLGIDYLVLSRFVSLESHRSFSRPIILIPGRHCQILAMRA